MNLAFAPNNKPAIAFIGDPPGGGFTWRALYIEADDLDGTSWSQDPELISGDYITHLNGNLAFHPVNGNATVLIADTLFTRAAGNWAPYPSIEGANSFGGFEFEFDAVGTPWVSYPLEGPSGNPSGNGTARWNGSAWTDEGSLPGGGGHAVTGQEGQNFRLDLDGEPTHVGNVRLGATQFKLYSHK